MVFWIPTDGSRLLQNSTVGFILVLLLLWLLSIVMIIAIIHMIYHDHGCHYSWYYDSIFWDPPPTKKRAPDGRPTPRQPAREASRAPEAGDFDPECARMRALIRSILSTNDAKGYTCVYVYNVYVCILYLYMRRHIHIYIYLHTHTYTHVYMEGLQLSGGNCVCAVLRKGKQRSIAWQGLLTCFKPQASSAPTPCIPKTHVLHEPWMPPRSRKMRGPRALRMKRTQ